MSHSPSIFGSGAASLSRFLPAVLRTLLTSSFILLPSYFASAAPVRTQQIPLRSGWNLISFQVGNSLSVGAFRTAISTVSEPLHPLIEIWSYDPSADPTKTGAFTSWQPKITNYPNDLTALQPGKGYWVNVSQNCTATLAGEAWTGPLVLQPGWNLAGFPGITLAENEVQSLASVFGGDFGRISQIWTFAAATNTFPGYDLTSIPAVKSLDGIGPGLGYWIYALDTVTLSPDPYIALEPDADISPLEAETLFSATNAKWLGSNPEKYVGAQVNFADTEDVRFDLNGNGIIDTPFTQDTIRFAVGADRKSVTIGNRRPGIADWAISNLIPWLTFDRTAGSISSETDSVLLTVKRDGLLPGIRTGDFTVFVGAAAFSVHVILQVPTSAGDWKGLAATQRVNGKNIPLGAVDMALNLFMTDDANFQAVLNQDTSLLFPRDVFLNGVFYSGNNFSLTTNFQMDPGDRNAPPYDTFSHQAPGAAGGTTLNTLTARGDKDYNRNGKADVQNPFPFVIHRQITLLGERKTSDRMEGSYIESITGMLPQNQPIFIEGTFFLDRQTLVPTKKSIFNGTTTNAAVNIGGTSGQPCRETTLTVGSPVSVQGVTVTIDIAFPDPSALSVFLIGPSGQTVPLSRNATTLATSYSLAQFNGVSGAGDWKLRVEWGNSPQRGTLNSWSLNVQGLATFVTMGQVVGDSGSGNQPLTGVHAILTGSNVIRQTDSGPLVFTAATTNTSTTVTLTSGSTSGFYADMPMSGHAAIPSGATVAGVTSATSFTISAPATGTASAPTTFGVAGRFAFNGLTENNYTVTLSKPGFVSRSIPFYLNNANYYLGHGSGAGTASTNEATLSSDPVILARAPAGSRQLTGSPFIGAAPLLVNYSLVLPLADTAGLGANVTATWNFGDGSPPVTDTASPDDDITLSTAKHLYAIAGDYIATVTLVGSTGNLSVPVTSPIGTTHVQRVQADTRPGAPAAQIFGVGFVGSFAAPLADGSTGGIEKDGNIVYQESKRDSASFDINRSDALPLSLPPPGTAATTTFNYIKEDSDFGDPNKLMLVSGNGSAALPFRARLYNNLPVSEQSNFSEDLSPNIYKTYLPPQGAPSERFRFICTMGGNVFGAKPALVGDFVLQTGRIEP